MLLTKVCREARYRGAAAEIGNPRIGTVWTRGGVILWDFEVLKAMVLFLPRVLEILSWQKALTIEFGVKGRNRWQSEVKGLCQ
jgi:hypothetical protein